MKGLKLMKTMENQELKPTNGLLGLVIMGLSIFLILPLGLENSDSDGILKNQKKAESLAYQILAIQEKQASESKPEINDVQAASASGLAKTAGKSGFAITAAGRGPASITGLPKFHKEGNIGLDQWGRPFLYKVQEFQGKKQVAVWSLGPNGKSETPSEEILITNLHKFMGDDVGIVLTIQQ